jgi:hypothetical protein
MRDIATLVVGLVATTLLCVESLGAFLAFGWSLIHGAGASGLLVFLPLILSLSLIWLGYFHLMRRNRTSGAVLFSVYAFGIVALNELMLPATALKAWRNARAMSAVDVRDMRDEPLVSANGTPIGIQLTYHVRFPATVVCFLAPGGLKPIDGESRPRLEFSGGYQQTISPSPERRDIYNVFRKDIVYAVSERHVLGFISYNLDTGALCLKQMTGPAFSDAAFLEALSQSRNIRYRTSIVVKNVGLSEAMEVSPYQTSRTYDLESFYYANVQAGVKPCDP